LSNHNKTTKLSITAWKKNLAPPIPTAYNQFFQITKAPPGSPTIFALVTWNWLKGYYEMEPIWFVDTSTYNRIELRLNDRGFYGLRRTMRNLGIKHMVGVIQKTRPTKSNTSSLPQSVQVITIS